MQKLFREVHHSFEMNGMVASLAMKKKNKKKIALAGQKNGFISQQECLDEVCDTWKGYFIIAQQHFEKTRSANCPESVAWEVKKINRWLQYRFVSRSWDRDSDAIGPIRATSNKPP